MEAPIATAKVLSEIKEKNGGGIVLYYRFHVLLAAWLSLAVEIIARSSHDIFIIIIDFSMIKIYVPYLTKPCILKFNHQTSQHPEYLHMKCSLAIHLEPEC